MSVGVSIGLAEIDGSAETLAAVMSAADVACYSAKDSGPQPRADLQAEPGAGAPPRDAVGVAHQPRLRRGPPRAALPAIVPIRAGVEKLRHFELLLRMRDEQGQLVQPAEFIPAAERFNLMPAIDRWVVRQACAQLAHRRGDRGPPSRTCSRSTSRRTTLNDEQFLDFVIR